MHDINLVLSLVGLAAALGGGALAALSHSPRIAKLEAKAETAYVHDTTPAEREAVGAFLHEVAPELKTAANGDAAALEREALSRASRFASSLGYTIPAADILGAVQQGAKEGWLAAAVQAADAAVAGAAPAAAGTPAA